jgi:Domain of unknown function (DUF6316)
LRHRRKDRLRVDYIRDNGCILPNAEPAHHFQAFRSDQVAMKYRKNESPKTRFRSERVFRANSLWYFHTREGIDVGPFNSEFEAQVEASILKNLLKDKPSAEAKAAIRDFILDIANGSSNLKSLTDYVVKEGKF